MQAGRIKTDLTETVEGLKASRSHHMGHDYYNFPSIRVAEFLDVEVFHTVTLSEWRELRGDGSFENQGLISNFLLEKDTVSPAEIARRIAAAAPTNRVRQRTLARRELTEEEETMEFLNEGLGLSEVNPLHAEFKAYTQVAKALSAEDRSTLGFWKTYEHRFPILAKVARKLLCASGTSCDVERLFSRAGLICSALRNRLLPKTIQCLTTMHYYYAEEEKVKSSTREQAAIGRAKRFASLTSTLLVQSHDSYISDSDSEPGDF
jgi:hypothetical protein